MAFLVSGSEPTWSRSSLQQSFSYLKPIVGCKLEAHFLDKRAYLEGDWTHSLAVSKAKQSLSCFESQVLSAVAHERRPHTHSTNGTRRGVW